MSVVDIDDFWAVIDATVLAAGDLYDADFEERFCSALTARLGELPPEEIVAFGGWLAELFEYADIQAVLALWAVAGRGRRSFDEFVSGLITLGRDVFERALLDPDSLAEHPVFRYVAETDDTGVLYAFWELVPEHVYRQRTGQRSRQYRRLRKAWQPPAELDLDIVYEYWDYSQPAEVRRRLPRLAALFA